jgi:quercetin dioxygenase-like cupin family protein
VLPLSLSPFVRYIRRMPDDKQNPSRPAEYALGLLRGGEAAAAQGDDGLRKEAEGWQQKLASLDGADSEPLPPGSFEKILDRIDAAGIQLPGTATQRADNAEWRQHSEGIVYRVLKVDEARQRQTLLVKMQPGAIYKSHAHDIEEECLVIEGDLRYGDFVLRAGDYHLAAAGTHHPVGTTTAGCLLHVVVGMEI